MQGKAIGKYFATVIEQLAEYITGFKIGIVQVY